MTTKKRTTKPETIQLCIIDKDGQRTQDSFFVDIGLLRKQARTIGKFTDDNGPFLLDFTKADKANMQGAWNLLHGILDGAES